MNRFAGWSGVAERQAASPCDLVRGLACRRTVDAINNAFATVELGCTDIAPTDDVVTVEVPPVRRLKQP